jgi:hypothetical protein
MGWVMRYFTAATTAPIFFVANTELFELNGDVLHSPG